MPGPSDRGGRERPKNARGALRRILDYLMNYKYTVLLLVILALLCNLGNLLGPTFAGKAINAISPGKGKVDFEVVTHYALLMLSVYVGSSVISFFVGIGIN